MTAYEDVRAELSVPERYAERPPVDREYVEDAIEFVLERVDEKLESGFRDAFPPADSDDYVYEPTDVSGWTASFWTGQCWLAYEYTGEETYRDAAETQLEAFEKRVLEGDVKTHDLGFLYSLSAVAAYRVTGDRDARELALTAADHLAERFWPAPGMIQAWADPAEPNEWSWAYGRMIVDTMMNLPLLFWAAAETDHRRYADIAATHARTAGAHLVRSDASTYHTFQCDVETGEPLVGETFQGHADESTWARGQAWAMYGYPLCTRYTGDGSFADLAAELSTYYLARVDKDEVPIWDFDAPDDARDSSAAAIAACGLDELAVQLPMGDPRAPLFRNAALRALESLTESYTTEGMDSNGILKEGTYHHKEGNFDECTAWGDYFYFEALVRAHRHWEPYW